MGRAHHKPRANNTPHNTPHNTTHNTTHHTTPHERITPMLDLNTLTRTDITTIDWEYAPAGFDQSGTLYAIQVADLDGIQLILGHDIDAHKSSLAAEVAGHWYDTSSTQDWPVFDALFGRDAWQELVTDHQRDAIAELADDEDEE